jgi:hypothetical protein
LRTGTKSGKPIGRPRVNAETEALDDQTPMLPIKHRSLLARSPENLL